MNSFVVVRVVQGRGGVLQPRVQGAADREGRADGTKLLPDVHQGGATPVLRRRTRRRGRRGRRIAGSWKVQIGRAPIRSISLIIIVPVAPRRHVPWDMFDV